MFSVFSNTKKPSEQIKMVQQCAGASLCRWLIAGPEDEPLWMLKTKMSQLWLGWINRKILFVLPEADKRTVDVRIRIATAMLNSIAEKNLIPKDICIKYHERLVSNTNLLYYRILAEDLPF